ncbi:MAG: GGDEF domain-containing phosphodiesterase [Pyrinomonadaceae bacterium]|nr:GGDEF domain-containing phosphodiesterase [Pyrinomonadaceae bacterium]
MALSGENYQKPEEMLRDADIAMYRAKAAGKACYQTFDRTMHEQANSRLQMEIEMRRGIESGEFIVYYQPIVNLETDRIIGFESLVRWNHPERGVVSPVEFIPLAEETGLIVPLGLRILRESCRQMREWQSLTSSLSELTISVNLSCKQFSQPDLVEQVAGVLAKTNLDPRCLKLEITESHVMENSQAAVAMMNRLVSLGVELSVELSLDDFGTGYSSMSYLHRLPANFLKIDRSFVSRMIENDENYNIVHTIIRLAQNLKMKVIAEGIETAEQLSQLKKLGCDCGQGYLLSKPLTAEAAGALLDSREGSPYWQAFNPAGNNAVTKCKVEVSYISDLNP